MPCQGKYVLLLMLLWTYDVLLSEVLENYFVTLCNYKLDDSPLMDIDMTENNLKRNGEMANGGKYSALK